MTRKDYQKLAAALAIAKPVHGEFIDAAADSAAMITFRATTLNIADVLQADNPRFDRSRFLKAAGVL